MRWYNEVCSQNPLTYTEIKAWTEVMRVSVWPWEARLLRSIDRSYWKVHNE